MGLFKSKEEKAEESKKITEAIRNSECANLFANVYTAIVCFVLAGIKGNFSVL